MAMHLKQLNVVVALISAVGDDRLGHELRRRLYNAGVDISLLGVHKDRETGFVLAELQDKSPNQYPRSDFDFCGSESGFQEVH